MNRQSFAIKHSATQIKYKLWEKNWVDGTHSKYKIVPLLRGFSEIRKIYEIADYANSHICGGYARYAASREPSELYYIAGEARADRVIPTSDIDIYSPNKMSHEVLVEQLNRDDFVKVGESKYSVTFRYNKYHQGGYGLNDQYVQAIKPTPENFTQGRLDQIIPNFDFTICKAAIISPEEVVVHENFHSHEIDRRVYVERDKDIRNSLMVMYRCIKYAQKGYKIDPRTIGRIFRTFSDKGEGVRNEDIHTFFDKFMEGDSGMTTSAEEDGVLV